MEMLLNWISEIFQPQKSDVEFVSGQSLTDEEFESLKQKNKGSFFWKF